MAADCLARQVPLQYVVSKYQVGGLLTGIVATGTANATTSLLVAQVRQARHGGQLGSMAG